MKHNIISLFVVLLAIYQTTSAQSSKSDPYFGETCTSITVGKKASYDGSVMTAHTCDGNYRTWMRIEKAKDYPDTARMTIYKGLLKTETPWDMRNVKVAGQIPQAKHTYAFLNTGYPSMNEKQLAIGEATIVGSDTLVNEKGMFLIEELERVVLQRCTTAREAIKLIDSLTKKYGYGDWGECLTIADKNEVWQLEIFGAGKNKIGAVWAAKRIPDDEVGVSANISRISAIEKNNPNYFMYSDNVFSVAKELNLWDGKSEFKFWKAYGDTKKPYAIREFWILSKVNPDLKLNMDMAELPFSVKPKEKMTIDMMNALYRADYENSPYDMRKNVKIVSAKRDKDGKVISQDTIISPIANPWLTATTRNTLNTIKPGTIDFVRTVSVSWCAYSHIIQLRSWLPDEIGGICRISFDNPAQSPRIPLFSGTTQLPSAFEYSGVRSYNDNAAIWKFRKANKLATVQWGSTKDIMLENILSFEEKAKMELPQIEAKAQALLKEGKKEEVQKLLNSYTEQFYGAATQKWGSLENRFWEMFGSGF